MVLRNLRKTFHNITLQRIFIKVFVLQRIFLMVIPNERIKRSQYMLLFCLLLALSVAGPVARSDAHPPGIQTVPQNILSWRLA